MVEKQKNKAVGYDKYVNPKRLSIAVGAFVLLLIVPTPNDAGPMGLDKLAFQTRDP